MYQDRPEDIVFKNDVRARKREVLDRTITDATSNDFNERFVREVATRTGVDLSTDVYDRTRRGAEMIVESWQNKINDVMAEPWTMALRPQTVRDLLWHAEYDKVMQKIGPDSDAQKEQLRRQELDRFSNTLDRLVNRDVSDLLGLDLAGVHAYSPVPITDDFAQYLMDNQNTEVTGTIAEAIAIIDHADPDATTTDVTGTIDNPGRDASAFFAEPDAYHTGAQGTLEQYYRMILGELDIETDLQDYSQTRNDTELTHRPATHLELIARTQEFQDSNLERPASYSGAYLLTVCPQSRQAFFESCLSPGLDNPQGIADDYRAKMRVIAEGLIQQNRRKLKRNPELCEELYEISKDLDLQRDILDILLRARDSEGTRMVPWRKSICLGGLGTALVAGALWLGSILGGNKEAPAENQRPRIDYLPTTDLMETVKLENPSNYEEHQRVSIGGVDYGMTLENYEKLEQFLRDIKEDLKDEYTTIGRYLLDETRRPLEMNLARLEHIMSTINQETVHMETGEEEISASEIDSLVDAYSNFEALRGYRSDNDSRLTIGDILFGGQQYGNGEADKEEPRSALCYFLQGREADRPVEELFEEIEQGLYETRIPTEVRD